MALSRVKIWSEEILEPEDLNAEFNNILDNPMALISPMTADLAAGGNSITGLATGSVTAPSLSHTGDPNTGIYFATDAVNVAAGGVRAMSFATAATAVNYLIATPGAAGSPAILGVEGTDTNADIQIKSKGTGNVVFLASAATVGRFQMVASAVNFWDFQASATLNDLIVDATGSDTNIGMVFDAKGAGSQTFRYNGGANESGRISSGILLWGTTVATGADAGDIVIKNGDGLQFVNAAGTTSVNFGILSSSDSLVARVPEAASSYSFQWGTTELLKLVNENGGAGILFDAEASADHTAPTTNQVVIYLRDTGGKTELVARFATGAVQQIAIEP